MSLEEVLTTYKQPIDEKQAWAVCYQCCSGLNVPHSSHGTASQVKDPSSILLHRDGAVSLQREPHHDNETDGPLVPSTRDHRAAEQYLTGGRQSHS
uniref:KIND domain-containing protein n=1 Tax=Amphilophus citrinellus TaxID=61819 RepID=A0A3Q0RLQ1_AMPCI